MLIIARSGSGSGVETIPKKSPPAPESSVPGTMIPAGAIAANEEAASAITSNARSARR